MKTIHLGWLLVFTATLGLLTALTLLEASLGLL